MHIREVSQDRARAERRIDRPLAAKAMELAIPLIENAMKDPRHGDSGFLHVVVLDPAVKPGGGRAVEDAILYEYSFGDRARWDADYAMYARGKAEAAWKSGADNPRGAVSLDGIVVGASGAFECFDRAYAGVVAQCLRALHALECRAC